MEKLIIKGGKKLFGDVCISGAKNAALPILASTLLCEGVYRIKNVPHLRDVATMNILLSELAVKAELKDNEVLVTNEGSCDKFEAPYDVVKTMRASILVLGPLLAKCKKARVSLPGGCAIGARPVDLHISALEKMGATITLDNGYINASCERLKGAEIIFDKVTVTGTENIMAAATLADGVTVLKNAAEEPEVLDLARFLKKMGADIEGEGSNTIIIKGKDKLHSCDYEVMPDRIEAGTFLCAVGIAGGKITLNNAPSKSMDSVIEKLRAAGLNIEIIDDKTMSASMDGDILPVDVKTAPYPLFPTDMQAQIMALMIKSKGVSVITESIFENRFMHVSEYERMGAYITLKDSNAIIKGIESYSGAPVMASDLRASAGLVIAGLGAQNVTEIRRIYHLDRGYDAFEKKLRSLGADIERVKDDEN